MEGLIPARAGNTKLVTVHIGFLRAHPRSRGEHHSVWKTAPVKMGSSPLARGTLPRSDVDYVRGGLIPARAGNTSPGVVMMVRVWAHPRSRGEHPVVGSGTPDLWGSSPLARGTRDQSARWSLGMGLIPARAGNTERLECS